MTWNMSRNNKKSWKMRNTHYRTWNMARKLKNFENEKHTLGREMWEETLKNMKNEKYRLYELNNGQKTEKRGK